jgi:hypothetical protein
MSIQITTAFVQQYNSLVLDLAEQKMSRLRNRVMVKTGVVGKSTYMDQIGSTEAVQKTGRHDDTPLISIPHSRRRIDLGDWVHADLIDEEDKVRTLIDPSNAYARKQASAFGRRTDREIITAALGTSFTGETGATSVTFPSGQQVAVNSHTYGTGSGNAGLTISKLIEAKVKLDAAEVDEIEDRTIIVSSQGLGNLLATTQVTSSDFNQVQALVAGKIDTFLGFKFVRSELLPVDSNSYRRVIAFAKGGIGLGIGRDLVTNITPRPDKNYATQVHSAMTLGATRLEEAKVVEIKCLEV